ncbi:hypothetical protein [Rhizomonospora bruguierae]|uniref:hypothetical protein n=1 Tax=Rhizomonospora bruguierae TaxID=1581705 RepID=UPI001BCD66C7|nr:hypothetical protein [Micromonospora sp. NBRC 107566]
MMNRIELLRRRRLMHRRIQDLVAERRLAVPPARADEAAAPPGADDATDGVD